MGDVAVLAGLKWREVRNRFRGMRETSRFKAGVITFFAVLFWLSLFRLFSFGLDFLRRVAENYYFEDLIASMLDIFFFALTVMLVFSNAIIGYSSFFRSKETGFLLATPVRAESVFLYKFLESLAFSSWAFLFLATPLMAAYGTCFDLGASFYVGTGIFFLSYVFIPASVGAIVAMVVTVYVPRTKTGLILAFAGAVAVILLVLISKLLSLRGGYAVDVRLVLEVFDEISFSRNPLLPSYWISRGIRLMRQGAYGDAAFFLGVIGANAAFLMVVAHGMANRLLLPGWFLSQNLKSGRRYRKSGAIDAVFGALLCFASRGVRLIVVKDVKSFLRDPVQWTQFLIFFGLLGIYFLNLRSFSYEERDPFWKNLIAQMNLLATSLTLATFASRFIYPQLSLEGRRFWIIGMVPIEREKILWGKLALSFTCTLIISELLMCISSVMLRTPPIMAMLHAVALFGVCLGLSGLSVGLGALYPNFAEDNPSKIVSGFGGTLNLVLSLAFVLGVMSLQGLPCFLHYGPSGLPAGEFRMWIAGAMIGIALLSTVTCLVPMGLGLRSIRRLEI